MKKINLLALMLIAFSITYGQVIENFDDVRLTWTESPAKGIWEIGKPNSILKSDFDNQNLLATNLDGAYLTTEDVSIESSVIFIPPKHDLDGKVFLEMIHQYQFHTIHYGRVQISTLSGDSVATLESFNSSALYWKLSSFDITGFAGKLVKIKFVLDVYPSFVNTFSNGWFIDHLVIRRSNETQLQPLTFDINSDLGIAKDSSSVIDFEVINNSKKEALKFQVSSSNQALIADSAISISTSDNQIFKLKISPQIAKTGVATINLTLINGNSVVKRTLTVYVFEPQLVVGDDFESSNGMTWQELPYGSSVFQIGKPQLAPKQGFNSQGVLGTITPEGYNFSDRSAVNIQSAPFTLYPLQNGTYSLEYNQWRKIVSCCGDEARIYIVRENGEKVLLKKQRYNNGEVWENINLSLNDFEGETISIAFELFVYGTTSTYYSGAWFIDNVAVNAYSADVVTNQKIRFVPIPDHFLYEENSSKLVTYVDTHGNPMNLHVNSSSQSVIANNDISVLTDGKKILLEFKNVSDGVSEIELIAESGAMSDTLYFDLIKIGVQNKDSLALVDFYNQMNLRFNSNFKTWLNGPLSTWSGVTLGSNNRVEKIEFQGKYLTGTLHSSLGELDSLKYLNLSSNIDLKGTLPDFLTKFEKLSYLALSGVGFTGTLPESIGDLVNLEEFYGQSMRFTGGLPNTFKNLKKLRVLNFNSSLFTGMFPAEIYELTNLESIEFNRVKFTGKLSSQIKNLTKLKKVDFGFCVLSGDLPNEMSQLVNLEDLKLNYNSFTSLPNDIGDLKNLQILLVNNNQITVIPNSIRYCESLVSLSVASNKIEGEIPVFITELTTLESLNLSNNKFTGTVPSSLGNLKLLKSLNVDNNQMKGVLTSSIDSLTQLTNLNIENNYFTELPNIDSLILINMSFYARGNQLSFSEIEKVWNSKYKYFEAQRKLTENQFFQEDEGQNIDFVFSAGGSATSYQWYENDTLLPNQTDSVLRLDNVTNLNNGKYVCKATNAGFAGITLVSGGFELLVNELGNLNPVIDSQTLIIPSSKNYTTIGTFDVTDVDDTDLSVSIISGNYVFGGDVFRIYKSNSGFSLYMSSNSFHTKPKHELVLKVTDGRGGYDTATFTIITEEVSNKPIVGYYQEFDVMENVVGKDSIGYIDASSQTGKTLWYKLNGTPSPYFEIDSVSGVLYLKEYASLNFEKFKTFSTSGYVSEINGEQSYFSLKINVKKDFSELYNFMPSVNNAVFTIKENITTGSLVGIVKVIDANGDSVSVIPQFTETAFEINLQTREVFVKNADLIDFEKDSIWYLPVLITDGHGGDIEMDIVIHIEDVAEGIVANDKTFTINENHYENGFVGTLDAINKDGGLISYKFLDSTASNPFKFYDANSGVILVANSALLDYEKTTSFQLEVEVIASISIRDTILVTVNLNDLFDDVPVGLTEFLNEFKVYPTIVVDELSIESKFDLYTVSITAINGMELSVYTLSGNSTLDLSEYATGEYLVRIMNGDTIVNQKIVKQ